MFIRVLLPLPFSHPFDYTLPEGMEITHGDYVRVSFGKKEYVGIVWELVNEGIPYKNTKEILEKISFPLFPQISRKFIEWVARYTLTPLGLVFKMAISAKEAFETTKKDSLENLSKPFLVPVELSEAQSFAVKEILTSFLSPSPPSFLLDGVTGSGKTEVYFEVIQKSIENQKQALVLLPEISLSSQWLERFQHRFGVIPTLWNSSLTKAQRRDNWRKISRGKASVIVGARSALFLPYPALGVIIVDEEHDSSFKQEETVIYNARDMAVVRGKLACIPVILASATPSLESLENCRRGKYTHLSLPSRHGGAHFPKVEIVDMRYYTDKQLNIKASSKWISSPLFQALQACLTKREQALLFLNRRGYAPLSLCGSCGERVSCPYCTAWLVNHRYKERLSCHHCGHTINLIKNCLACGKENSIVACGPGVERVAEDLTKILPTCRYTIVTSDLIQTPKAMREIVLQFQNHELDILIGTQMLAKGFHFPNLTLVGVIDADLGLAGTDLRAAEKTYQLLHQVSGRAGREEKPGQVFLQTYQPSHPLFAAIQSHNREEFLDHQKLSRELENMPPFGKLASLIVSSANSQHIQSVLRDISSQIPSHQEITVWGPAPAPLALLKGKQRWRYLLKAPQHVKVQPILETWLKNVLLPRTVKLQIDIDPYSFL